MQKWFLLLVALLLWSVASYGQIATKSQWGVARSTDSLNETRDGFLLGPGAGRYLKRLVDTNKGRLDSLYARMRDIDDQLSTNADHIVDAQATADNAVSAVNNLASDVNVAANSAEEANRNAQDAVAIATNANQNANARQPTITPSTALTAGTVDASSVNGSFIMAGNEVRTPLLRFKGQSDAETVAFAFTPIAGVGVRLLSWISTTSGTFYNQGNAQVKADGDLLLQGNGSTLRLTTSAVSVNRGNNAPRAGFDVGSDMLVDGNMKLPTVDGRWFGFDGLSSGQTVRLRMGDPTGGLDVTSGAGMTVKAYHGIIVQNQSGGAGPALRVNGLSAGQNIFEFYNAANTLRSWMNQNGRLFAAGGYQFADGTVQTTAAAVTSAPVTVTIAANQTALLNAIAAATSPTIISWVGSITLTSDIELQNKSDLFLNCYGKGSLYRDNSPNMIIIRGGIKNCGIRGISFSNQSGGSNGNTILFNEQGAVENLYIEYNTFTANGSENNGIASNSSGGAQDQFVTTHNGIYIRYNKFQGIPRMAVELKNHSADGATPTWCERIFIEYNDISDCGTGSADGYGISLSGLFRYGRMAYNTIVNAKKYSLEGVLISDYVIEHNVVTDITTTSNGLSLSNGYKAVAQIPVGANRRVIVRNNTFNVKGRSILSYWYNNCEFTRNTGSSQQRNEWIGDDNTITANTFDVYNDWNAMQFATANRNRIVDNKATTYYHGNGVFTSSVLFLDASANNNFVRSNTLTRPVGSFNVHIEQNASVTNDIGTTAGSATNTLNTYVERRAGTLGNDQIQVNTFADLLSLGTVTVATTVYVIADEKNNPGSLGVYTLLPSGKRIRFAAIEDN